MINIKDLKTDLEKKIQESEKMIIVPHNKVDFDAIASAIALSLVGSKYKKNSQIIVNDPPYIMERGCKIIMDDAKADFNIINKDKYSKIYTPEDLFVLTDVNKKYLISVDDMITNKDKTLIIDHHEPDKNTVETNSLYIDSSMSSASEIVFRLLNECKIKIPQNVANYLLAGIYLDTSKFVKNASSNTMEVVSKLMCCGADMATVSNWFTEDLESYKRVHSLVSEIELLKYTYALIVANKDVEYEKEELAKAADEALKFDTDAAFVIGRLSDDIVGVSARSKGKVNVEPIMQNLGGGGNITAGAAQIKNGDVEEVGKSLKKILKPSYYVNR
ncbi:MAG: DHH family phosphoesterase [Bacilli bacterium]|nr:DHH family phosphoesterase [Bacilli bacterium]